MTAPPGSLATAHASPPRPLRAGRPASGHMPPPELRLADGFASDAERATVLAWLEAGLRPERPSALAREYPLLLGEGGRALPITIFAGSRPVSFCTLWPVRFDLPTGALRAGLVSLVFTDPAARGRGLARRVIARAVECARERALGIVLLWSELDAFYAGQGFTRAGREQLLTVDGSILSRALAIRPDAGGRDPGELEVAAASPADWESIGALRRGRPCSVGFGREELAALARIPDLEVLVARDARGIAAFAMQGRGEDFAGVVHEWGGDAMGVLRCLAGWLPGASDERGLLLLAPSQRTELAWRLRSAGARSIEHPLAWMRIASGAALAADLAALAPPLAARLDVVEARSGEERAFGRLRDEVGHAGVDLTQEALLALLFSPATDPAHAAARDRLQAVVPPAVLDALPLPFFVWGLESI